ncbi:MAG: hypothetical protein HC830_02040, partial [Bacteroidetes bacterium]|nr:hypothetical protein [Bacteroidota bacterium]
MRKVKIPFDIVEIDPGSYHIFINCYINGNKHDMLIDTGASRTVFDMEHFSESTSKISYDEILSSGLGPGNLSTNTGILKTFSI